MRVRPTKIRKGQGTAAPTSRLISLHVTHAWTPPGVLARIAATPAEAILRSIRSINGVRGCVALVTCHRCEMYLEVDDAPDVVQRVTSFFTTALFRSLVQQAPPSMRPDSLLRVLEGQATLRHALRVGAGLESKVRGEQEILRQVREAFNTASAAQTVSPALARLFQQALRVGRRVRRLPGYCLPRDAYVVQAVDLMQERLGALASTRVAVIGAGAIGAAAARELRRRHVGNLVLVNRSSQPAKTLAHDLGAAYRPLTDLEDALRAADAAIVAIGGGATIEAPSVASPLRLIVDLSAAPAVPAAVTDVEVVELGQVMSLLAQRHRPHAETVRRVEELVEAALHDLWTRESWAGPGAVAVRKLGEYAKTVQHHELERALRKLAHLPDRDQAVVRALAESLGAKLLRTPIVRLRAASAMEGQTILRLFDLDEEAA